MFLYYYFALLYIKITNSYKFPAEEFFASVHVDLTNRFINPYLCQDDGHQAGCCSCKDDCLSDCCIDIYWNETSSYTLEDYLHIFLQKHKEKKAQSNRSCQPIVSTLQPQQWNLQLKMKTCLEKSHDDSWTFQLPVWHRSRNQFYPTKRCAYDYGVAEGELTNLKINADCMEIRNVSIGTSLASDYQNHMINCIFSSRDSLPDCGYFQNNCDKRDIYYDLCDAYLAPTDEGSKNPHCYFCERQNKEIEIISIGPCTDLKDFQYIYPTTLDMYEKENIIFVEKIKYRFPLIDFYGLNPKRVHLISIKSLAVCSSSWRVTGCCDCDEHCYKFRTCCVDFFWNESKPVSIQEYKKSILSLSKVGKIHACKGIKNRSVLRRYRMVFDCPSESYDEYRKRCLSGDDSNWSIITPVIGSDGYLYRNFYCALCHSIFTFQPVDLITQCKGDFINEICDIAIADQYDTNVVRKCSSDIEDDACRKDHELYDLCSSYTGEANGYRNVHCHLCNTTSDFRVLDATCRITKYVFSWTMLISFTDNLIIKEIKNQEDKSLGFCDYGNNMAIQVSNGCPAVSIHNPNFDNCLRQFKTYMFVNVPKGFSNLILMEIFHHLNLSLSSTKLFHQTETYDIYKFPETLDFTKFMTTVQIRYEYILTHADGIQITLTPYSNPVLSEFHHLDFVNSFLSNRICYKTNLFNVDFLIFTSNCSALYNGSVFDFHTLSMRLTIDKNGIQRHCAKCDRFYMQSDCSLRLLNGITNDKYGIVTTQFEKQYSIDNYIPLKDDGVAVCATSTDLVISKMREIDLILSYLLVSCSIPCYLIVICTYYIFTELQNTPGLCIVALTCSLLISDTMFLMNGILNLTSYNKIFALCKTVAIIMHFAVVKAYVWTLLISFDLMKVLGTVSQIKNQDLTIQFYRYFKNAFIVSAGVVLVSFGLDTAGIVLIGYGENGTCLPHLFYGRVLFYIVPIFLCIFISSCFLTRTLLSLSSQKRRSKKVLRKSVFEKMSLTTLMLKLAFVLGVSEAIGIFQTAASSKNEIVKVAIGLMYTLIRSLRGCLIMFVYVCKKNVLDLYRRKMNRNIDDGSVKSSCHVEDIEMNDK